MYEKRIQNRICENRLLLPVALGLLGILWWLPRKLFDAEYFISLALCLLMTYVIMEMANRNALIRVFSRSISSLFLLFLAAMGFLHGYSSAFFGVVMLCLAYSLLARVDVVENLQAHLFHTFLFLALGMLFDPIYVIFVPLFYWYCLVYHRRLTVRAFGAGIIGLLLPFWIGAGVALLTDKWEWVQQWFLQLTDWRLPAIEDYRSMEVPYRWAWGCVGWVSLLSSWYYLNNRFHDKVRTRLLHYIFITQCGFIALVVILQPHRAPALLPAMILSTAPSLGHYFTLQRTRWGTWSFFLLLLVLAVLAAFTCFDGLAPWFFQRMDEAKEMALQGRETAMEWWKFIIDAITKQIKNI